MSHRSTPARCSIFFHRIQTFGILISFMFACSGVLFPFLELHFRQAATCEKAGRQGVDSKKCLHKVLHPFFQEASPGLRIRVQGSSFQSFLFYFIISCGNRRDD